MEFLLLVQFALPLALLTWLALAPLSSRVGLTVQAIATALLLLALHLSGLWLIPPWWTPWLYWPLFGLALFRAARREREARLPKKVWGWLAVMLLTGLGAYAGATAAQALRGRRPPVGPHVELHFPLEKGRYYVANGGTNTSVSSHAATLVRATLRQREFFGQSHAVDIVGLNRLGFQATGLNPDDPALYVIFGAQVLAPCSGRVVRAVDGKPDMKVPIMDRANMAGNHVLLRCGQVDVLLAHLRRGSVHVATGNSVRTGLLLGEVGNSGNSSTPHLHIHAQLPGTTVAPLSGTPLPMRIDGAYLVRSDRP